MRTFRPLFRSPAFFLAVFFLGSCASPSSPTAPEPSPPSPPWIPTVQTPWQYQLTDYPVDTSVRAEVYFVDLFEVSATTVAALQKAGHHVICYFSAGSWENWRPDADRFPPEIIGKPYSGWPGEKWLDIRRLDLLGPILEDRLDLCREKGFEGADPDNVDGYENDTGFPLTYQDQLAFNRWLAEQSRNRGLLVGLKNDLGQVPDLVDLFDWAVVEECFPNHECRGYRPFIRRGKPVFAVEYTDTGLTLQDFCPHETSFGFSAILKHRRLDAFLQACP